MDVINVSFFALRIASSASKETACTANEAISLMIDTDAKLTIAKLISPYPNFQLGSESFCGIKKISTAQSHPSTTVYHAKIKSLGFQTFLEIAHRFAVTMCSLHKKNVSKMINAMICAS